MKAIAAIDLNYGIGKDNDLLVSIPEDMKRFRSITTGGTVLMGRKTLESFPNSRPLPKRRNIVLSSRMEPVEGVEIAHDIDELLSLVADDPAEEVYVIGGGQVYSALLPHCDKVLLTRVYASPEADAFFPDLDADGAWKIESESELLEEDGLTFRYIDYVRA